jgi:hypothetical protein
VETISGSVFSYAPMVEAALVKVKCSVNGGFYFSCKKMHRQWLDDTLCYNKGEIAGRISALPQ